MFVSNILSSGCLGFVAQRWGAHLVYASAAIVCGTRSPNIGPSSPVVPDTNYALSKWLAERLIEYSGARQCTLRIGGVFK